MDVKDVVAKTLAAKPPVDDAYEADRRAEVRAAAETYLAQWGGGTLPKGVRGNSMQCVFAKALGGSWTGASWQLPEDRLAFKIGFQNVGLPDEVGEFIHRFDNGEYPDLILDSDPGLTFDGEGAD